VNWHAWARRAERALAFDDASVRWPDLFAPGATFADPATASTTSLRDIQHGTASIFPDWRQEITSIRGADTWAVFEWIGRATYAGRSTDDPAAGTRIEMHGATIVEVDADGLVTMWRDYLDRREPEEQLRKATRR
jgi:hypothetical protein